jgi:hypothetical protein
MPSHRPATSVRSSTHVTSVNIYKSTDGITWKESVDAGFKKCMNDVSPSSLTNFSPDTTRTALLIRSEFNIHILFTKTYLHRRISPLRRYVSFLRSYSLYIYPSVAGPLCICVDPNTRHCRTSTNFTQKFRTTPFRSRRLA